MADNDDVERVLAACTGCGSVYAARQWPDGEIRSIGQGDCDCGSADFQRIDGSDIESADGSDRE